MFPSTNQTHVYLLGAFRVELKTQSIRLPTRKIEALLAYLILHPGIHAREKLASLFWGDSSDTAARGSLRKALTLLRKHVGNDLIIADRETVQVNPSFPVWADVNAFETQAQELLTRSSPELSQFETLCYQGDLLSGFYDDWILPLREHYRGLYLDVMLRAVEQARAQSEYQLRLSMHKKSWKRMQPTSALINT
jgi:DNA-binding SARP family transcriptional activator